MKPVVAWFVLVLAGFGGLAGAYHLHLEANPRRLLVVVDSSNAMSGMLPRVEVRALTARHLGRSLHEIELELANAGYLPTALAHGVTTQEVHPTRVILDVDDGDVLAGARRTTLEPIAGSGGVQKARWVVKADGRDRIDVEIVSALGGRIETSISLGGGR